MLVNDHLSQRISAARAAALATLELVAEGAYASDTLRDRTAGLESRDAALAGQIVFGSLRFQAQLDHLIRLYSGKSVSALDRPVVLALRMAIYQLRYLERIPAHAAVHEAVEIVKVRRRPATGFVNAVLRKVNRQPVTWPSEAVEFSCPEWLLARWKTHFGEKEARAIAVAALEQPTPHIRIPPGRSVPEGITLEATDVAGCYRVLSDVPLGIRLHDIGSQAIVPALDLQPGHTYLDVCAAPGNKTLQALETALSLAVACDVSPTRIMEIPPVCYRVVMDATQPLPLTRNFDRILVDAPCSGTGTFGRNPEIKWRVKPQDFERFRVRQKQILRQTIPHIAPGGKLLYATCSLEEEENERVIEAALHEHPDLEVERDFWRLPGRDPGDGFFAAVLAFK